jgi:hypothetical protein
MRSIFLILTLFSLLISCQSNKQSAAEIEQLPATIEEKIELFFESQSFEDWKISIEEKENILSFYKERKFKPIWIGNQKLTKQGEEVTKLINHSIYFGLPEKRYQFESDTNRLLENEIKTSILLGRMACDLKKGVFQKDTTILNPIQFVNASELNDKSFLGVQTINDINNLQKHCMNFVELIRFKRKILMFRLKNRILLKR